MRAWFNVAGFLIGVLITPGILLTQEQWQSSGCNGYTPTLDRIAINSCAPYEPDEYLLFHTNQEQFSPNANGFRVQVNVSNGPYTTNSWGSNASELAAMNAKSGCGEILFIDPFKPPYNGTIPPFSNVIAFVQRNPSFNGNVSGLCNYETVFVLFGNFTHYFAKSMFGNTCGSKPGCERNIEVQLGSCNYDIIYHPDKLANTNGAYIQGSGSSVQYGSQSNCKPAFRKFPKTPKPKMNRTEISLCKNSSPKSKFSALNGNNHTSWYTDLNNAPIARGPTFKPPPSIFPPLDNGKKSSRKIYVVNESGGRASDPVELAVSTLPSPIANKISLKCPNSSICKVCKNEPIELILDLDHNSNTGGYPYSSLLFSFGSKDTIIPFPPLGETSIYFPPMTSPPQSFTIKSVENQYGCIETIGFAQESVKVYESVPVSGYLPSIPDFCSTDPSYALPVKPGNVKGKWELNNKTVSKINPGILYNGEFTLHFEPNQPCTHPDSAKFNIYLPLSANITLPPINCKMNSYSPELTPGSLGGGEWTVSPGIPINKSTGTVLSEDLIPLMDYTFTYSISKNSCSTIAQKSITMVDCSCNIDATVKNTQCQDNGTPSNPNDDTFTFQINASGLNTGSQWTTGDGAISGYYNTPVIMGPYPISEGPKSLSLQDKDQSDCRVEITVDPPASCSDQCIIEAVVSNIQCHNNGTPSNPNDDTFTFQINASGLNTGSQWTTGDGAISGYYNKPVIMGPYPISEGPKSLILQDKEQPDCRVEITVKPPAPCSDHCIIEAETFDTVYQIDQHGNTLHYLYILIETIEPDPQYWIYYRNQLIDVIPGKGRVAIGPFRKEDGGKKLIILLENSPMCQDSITVPYQNPQTLECAIHLKRLILPKCEDLTFHSRSDPEIKLGINSHDFPVTILANDILVGKITDSLVHSFLLPQLTTDSIRFTLKASDECQLEVQSVNRCYNPTIIAPNAFSPNQDGVNDQWIVRSTPGISFDSIIIYDRWGNIVFSQGNQNIIGNNIVWDGSINNLPVEAGLYIYHLVWSSDSKTNRSTGEILVIR